jgi:O-antigen ligase
MASQNLATRFNPLAIARWLIILVLVALLFSPPVTSFFEFSLYGIVLYSGELRQRLFLAIKQPLVSAMLLFYSIILFSSLYSLVSMTEALIAFLNWHKILLLPLAVALFDENLWKQKLVLVFIAVTTVCAVLSFLSTFFDFAVYNYPAGITIRNHATQGIMFSVAAFSASMMLVLEPKSLSQFQKRLLSLSIILLIANIIYITPGRSGYLAFIVLGAMLAFTDMYSNKRFIVPATILIVIPLLLLSSPTVRQRVMQGTNEAIAYNSNAEATSMGMRMVLWNNTIDLIRARPLLGYGTGGFQKAYQSKIEKEPAWKHEITHDPHNQFLKITTEQGLVGLVVFLAMILSAFWQRPSFTYYGLGIGILLVWCGNSLFSSHFSTFSEGRFVFLWCGAMLANKQIQRLIK